MSSPIRQNRIISLLVIAICLTLLWLNHRVNSRIDVSANSRHSLASTTIDTLGILPEELNVIAIIGPDQRQREAITELIDRCRAFKPDIALEFINPQTNPDRVRQLVAAPGGELILQHNGRERRLNNLSERSFTQALHQLSRTSDRTLAFITGHQERSPDAQTNNDYAYLNAGLQRSGLSSMVLSLVSVPRIPDNIDVTVLAAPLTPLFPGEVASVLDYVNRGGNLLWLIEGSSLAGLKALALELGVEVMPGTVIDASSQAYGADSPTFAIIDSYPAHPVNEGLTSPVLLPQARALAITPLAGQSLLPLLITGENSWTETGSVEGAVKFDKDSDEQKGPLTLAVGIEREINGRTQRIAIVGDADLFASTWIGNGANQDYGERLINWLAADDQLITFDTVKPRDSMVELTKQQILILGAGFLLVLPMLLLIISFYRWYRQKHG